MPGIPREGVSASVELDADVLVIGGGPAGAWAAIRAAESGASVVLADKGWCGASGATAPSGTQIWYVPPDTDEREAAIAERYEMGGRFAERRWSERVLDATFEAVNRLAQWGYPFPVDENGVQQRISVQGPEYMRLMRRRVKATGARILDHHPALELLLDEDGTVTGAAGLRRQVGGDWLARARAVVLATGGCAFMSGALGCDNLTGDGHLMAAGAGADFSGMEFSNAYAISPVFASVTKTALYRFATFQEADGTPIPEAGSKRGRSVIAKTLLTRPVFARLDLADDATRTRGPQTRRIRGGRGITIEVIDAETCIGCDLCVEVCPTNVFSPVQGSAPMIARQADCQTCFMCELYCPVDALYVAPDAERSIGLTLETVRGSALLGSYRRTIGWAEGTRERRFVDDHYKLR